MTALDDIKRTRTGEFSFYFDNLEEVNYLCHDHCGWIHQMGSNDSLLAMLDAADLHTCRRTNK